QKRIFCTQQREVGCYV
ncbi:hypothetical protein D020_1127B, partial [Vibrio parahaemolyticus SBR10290]